MLKSILLTIMLICLLMFSGCASFVPVFQTVSPIIREMVPGKATYEFINQVSMKGLRTSAPVLRMELFNPNSESVYIKSFLADIQEKGKQLIYSKVLKPQEMFTYELDGGMFSKWINSGHFLISLDWESKTLNSIEIKPVLSYHYYQDIYQWIREEIDDY